MVDLGFSVRSKLSPRNDFIIGLAGVVILIAVWCVVTYGGFVKPMFLPRPTDIWEGLLNFQQREWLFPAIWRSFWRVTKALGLVILIGVPVGVLMGAFAPVDALLRKIIDGAKSVPTTGILGLVVLWLGLDDQGKVVFLFLGSIFYMIILVRNAVQSVNEDYIRVALDIGANRWQMVWRVLLPGALPQIWDAIAVCNGHHVDLYRIGGIYQQQRGESRTRLPAQHQYAPERVRQGFWRIVDYRAHFRVDRLGVAVGA